MPYSIRKKGNKWVVVKTDSGKVVAGNKTDLSREQALAAMRARYAHEKGK
jgi:hypothetical protein